MCGCGCTLEVDSHSTGTDVEQKLADECSVYVYTYIRSGATPLSAGYKRPKQEIGNFTLTITETVYARAFCKSKQRCIVKKEK